MSWNFYTSSGTETSQVGPQGNNGEGVPVGGATGAVLNKSSASNYATQWVPPGTTPVETKTSNYTPVTADAGKTILVQSAVNTTITINGSLDLTTGQVIHFVRSGAGRVLFTPSGATINGETSGQFGTALGRWVTYSLTCVGTDEYLLSNVDLGTVTGLLYSWGNAGDGALGNGTTTPTVATPTQISPTATNWDKISAGEDHCLAVRGGQLWAWGNNNSGQLGDNSTTRRTTPVRVGTESDWTHVAAGKYVSFGIRSGQLWAWGNNGNYQLGIGTNTANRTTPVRVGPESDWTYIGHCRDDTIFGIRSGQLWGWGYNYYGDLGTGDTFASTGVVSRETPVRIGTASDWTRVASGRFQTLGIRSGQLWAWGQNLQGELGDGTTTARTTPVRIGTESDWTEVSAGWEYTSFGIRSGQLWAWGLNSNSRLGDGTTTARTTPVRIGTATDWTAISSGFNFTLGIRNGQLFGWGNAVSVATGITYLGNPSGGSPVSSPERLTGVGADFTQVSAGDTFSIAVR